MAIGQVEGGPVIVSGGDDRTVRLWDAATSEPFELLPLIDLASAITSVALDGARRLAVGAELGVALLRLNPG